MSKKKSDPPQVKKGNFISHKFRNMKLRFKILTIVAIVALLLSVAIGFTINALMQSNAEIDTLVNVDMHLQQNVIEMGLHGNEIIAAVDNFALYPEDTTIALVNYNDSILNFNLHADGALTLANQRGLSSEITTSINGIKEDVANILILADGNSSNKGIFHSIEDQIEMAGDLQVTYESVDTSVDLLLTNSLTHANGDTLLPLEMELNDLLYQVEVSVLHYRSESMAEDKAFVEYSLGIINTTNIIDTTGMPQIPTLIESIQNNVDTNVTLQGNLGTVNIATVQLTNDVNTFFAEKDEFDSAIAELESYSHHLDDEQDALFTEIDTFFEAEQTRINRELKQTMTLVISVFAGAIIIALLVTLWTSNIIIFPLTTLRESADRLAEGDLTGELFLQHGHFHTDEVGQLEKSYFDMKDQLTNLVTTIQLQAESVTNSTEELSSAAEETNAATEEVSSVSQNMSKAAAQQAEMIGRSVEEIETLNEIITNVIDRIGENTSLISQIALQTNILALNAGIEASRAGDYGRGFAVVAENVRRLSEEAKKAASDITEVSHSVSDSLEGSFSSIKLQIEEVAALSQETAASAQEVAAATEEVTSSMEEVSASSLELSGQAIDSMENISRFRVQ